MLPAVRGILARTHERVHTDEPDDFSSAWAEEPSGKMPDGAGNMPALPNSRFFGTNDEMDHAVRRGNEEAVKIFA
jgi:hypothetical protein